MPSCAVRLCRNKSSRDKKDSGITYHLFPSDPVQASLWSDVIRRNRHEPFWVPGKSTVICSEHFESNDIYTTKNGQRRIRKGCVPKKSLFLSSMSHDCSCSAGHDKWEPRADGTEIDLLENDEDSVDEDSAVHDSDNSDNLNVEANKKRARTRIGSVKKSRHDIDNIDVEFDNIDKFGEQIAFLLKRIPRKLCRKLQDRIITLVKTVTKKYEIKTKSAIPGTSTGSSSTKKTETHRPILSPTLGRYTKHMEDEQIAIPEEAVTTNSTPDDVRKECTVDETTKATQYMERDLGTPPDQKFTSKNKRIHKPMVLPIELMGSMDCIKQEVLDTEESDDVQEEYNEASVAKNSFNPLETDYDEAEERGRIKKEQVEEEES